MVRETRSPNEESGHDTNNLQTVIKITPSIAAVDLIAEGGTTIAECWNISKQGRGQKSIISNCRRKRFHQHRQRQSTIAQATAKYETTRSITLFSREPQQI
jgi:hypothetical protein